MGIASTAGSGERTYNARLPGHIHPVPAWVLRLSLGRTARGTQFVHQRRQVDGLVQRQTDEGQFGECPAVTRTLHLRLRFRQDLEAATIVGKPQRRVCSASRGRWVEATLASAVVSAPAAITIKSR